jgi:heme-degrading monooxygenase HmoA
MIRATKRDRIPEIAMQGRVTPPDARYVRIWRGETRREKADEYETYWLANGIEPLIARGAVSVQMLRGDREDTVEFMTISYWRSLEAMTGGAGGDPRMTHHLERDPELLIAVPDRVQVLELLATRGN